MDKINTTGFYDLGAVLGHITRIGTDDRAILAAEQNSVDLIISVTHVRQLVADLMKQIPELEYCRPAAATLIDGIDRWHRAFTARIQGDDPIDLKYAVSTGTLLELARSFEHLLKEELNQQPIFLVTQTAGYSTFLLLTQAEVSFPEPAKLKLSPEVVIEVRESGRCLAHGTGTAAAFHMLRAVELVLFDYYKIVCKPKRKSRLNSWSDYLKKLKGAIAPVNDKTVARAIMMLENLAESERNLIMHPGKVLDTEEALGLIELCRVAIGMMAEKLPVDRIQHIKKVESFGITVRERPIKQAVSTNGSDDESGELR